MRSTSHHLQQLMASSSSSSITPELEYEVFLSFHGKDTRKNITSHLYEAFRQKNIKTFIDDNLIRGEEISPSLLKAIEQSKISVIIFSKGYASSRWCLKELEEILECKKAYDQIVLPVFYHVDPSNVRNQTGDFEKAFAKLEKHVMVDSEMLEGWRTALRDAADISGFHSKNYGNEASLVKTVVDEILKRLSDLSTIHTKNLVGLDSSIEEIENLLCMEGVRKVGIWGIAGIGKTTLATAVFNKIFRQFEVSYFAQNIREESEKNGGLNDMHRKLLCALSGDVNPNIGFIFPRERLIAKKVLIVFDDVTANVNQMEFIMEVSDYLDSKSRIIITTRDKHVLTYCRVCDIHEMKELSFNNALRLFTLCAFTDNSPIEEDYIRLSSSVVECAKGLPLALKVLGAFLFKRTKNEWKSALENLQINSYGDIYKVLKISYDGLDDREKDLFLDVACFFKGFKRDLIEAILNACGFSSHISINLLIEKCLITTSFDTITMHDLLKEMGREIVRQESIDNPGKCSRLWDPNEIVSVLKCNMGTEAIQSIRLDMSKVEVLDLIPKAFNNMPNLRFVEFYESEYGKKVPESDSSAWHRILRFLKRDNSNDGKKVHGFEKLKSDLSGLRYFCFHGYPAKSLPPNFNPKNLVALYMPNSKVKKLWTGNQDLVNLKYIDLSHSKHLRRIPDLSLMQNLESLNLKDCTNLLESFSSIHKLHKLVILYLQGCKRLKKFSISDNCQSLQEVNLSNCSNLKTVQHLPDTVEELYLDGTIIKELPSIGHLFRLVRLSLENCSRLERLPDSICELKSLKYLSLSNCSKLDRFPNDMGNLQTLEKLVLAEISFAEIPTFMTSLINLKTLSLKRCKMQKRLAFPLIDFSVFQGMRELCLIDCCIEVLPDSIGELWFLKYLFLDQNNFETLPESIKNISSLDELSLDNCKRLKYLPELPSDIWMMTAVNCISLESISSLPHIWIINFSNCFKLKLEKNDLLNIEKYLEDQYFGLASPHSFGMSICYPGCEIPERFDLKSNESFIKFPEGWVSDNLIGLTMCAVVSSSDYQALQFHMIVNGEIISWHDFSAFEVMGTPESDHVFIDYEYITKPKNFPPLNLNSQGGVEFFLEHATKNGRVRSPVKKCGVTLLYHKNDDWREDARVDKNDERPHE